jgi:2-polyprenyl-6-methoxyphenol hydroxylase-like FAD-dependent oxidoreductase
MQALESVAVSSGAAIKTSVDVEEVSPDGWVRTTNGEVHHADLVVGADGVRSVVRRALPTPAALVPLSFGGAVTLVPRLETDADVSNGYWTEYWSRTRHIYSAPVGGGCTYLAFFSLNFSDWRPHVSATDDTIKWTPLRPIDVDSWSERFPVVAGPLSRIEEAPVWSRFVEVRLRSWVGDRVVVIGDAAHAMAPALGSGGTTAMMDAITLAGAVGDGADLSARLQHWERAQRARVTPVQRSSRRWGRIFHMPTAVQWAVLFQGVNRTKFIHRLRFNYLTYKPVSLKP